MIKTLILVCVATVFATQLLAGEPKELAAARKEFQQASPKPTETERQQYVTKLWAIRTRMASRRATTEWQAVDEELRHHPLPKNADSKTLSAALVGKWVSSRHEYVYRKDGTWSMLPAEPGATHGRWHIDGNRFFDSVDGDKDNRSYTTILLTPKEFIFTDGEVVFIRSR